jgi:hypothetical protein
MHLLGPEGQDMVQAMSRAKEHLLEAELRPGSTEYLKRLQGIARSKQNIWEGHRVDCAVCRGDMARADYVRRGSVESPGRKADQADIERTPPKC